MAERSEFTRLFTSLTGHEPFPWQEGLYERFATNRTVDIPAVADLPTGLGKSSVIAIWLLALMQRPGDIPRRLVYVVNRRTVVDQTTNEVERLRRNLQENTELVELRSRLGPLAISTLRGQFADNYEWSADPSRPAVVCGTVDMIGSRLLFGGYRIGFRSRPLHAGFLGQDALLIHDEAHLEPAFQQLVETIQNEQKRERERSGKLPWPPLRVMALSATARNSTDAGESAFGLADRDREHPVVKQRIYSPKLIHLHPCADEKKLAEQITKLAFGHREHNAAVLIFVRKVDDVGRVEKGLRKNNVRNDHIATLTGTMRGYERDQLVKSNAAFARFMPPGDRPENITPTEGTVYLVCTSAGEVGVNLSADHMVCDLSTFDSMAQRLGRVNRFGDRDETRVDVVHPSEGKFDPKHPLTPAREATLGLLQQLKGDASPNALAELPWDQRLAAFTPEPTILPTTDILFDAWALTTIKDKMPGRPPVAPYLHGLAEWEPPRTSIAWREEVEQITPELIEREGEDFPLELLADYPIKPHELLSDTSERVLRELQGLVAQPKASIPAGKRKPALERANANAAANVWLVDQDNAVEVATLSSLLGGDKKEVVKRLAECTVLLPPSVGGLSNGMLTAASELANDVADKWLHEDGKPRRGRVWGSADPPTYEDTGGKTMPMALLRTIDIDPLADESAPPSADTEALASSKRFWHWYARPRVAENASRASARAMTWQHHTNDVIRRATEIVGVLRLPDDLRRAIILAAELHDLGKKRDLWQRSIGNPIPTEWYSKPSRPGAPFANGEIPRRWKPGFRIDYRHEFGSLLDVIDRNLEYRARLKQLPHQMQDVVLHLIAAHHGRARPHFSPSEIIDPMRPTVEAQVESVEVMRRYARLQRQFGRWGLAYLESLLRAADWDASANPSDDGGES